MLRTLCNPNLNVLKIKKRYSQHLVHYRQNSSSGKNRTPLVMNYNLVLTNRPRSRISKTKLYKISSNEIRKKLFS